MKRLDFEGLFAALPGPHMILDLTNNFVAVNEAYERLVGRPRDALVGCNLLGLFPNEDAVERLRSSIERVVSSGQKDSIAYLRYCSPSRSEQDPMAVERYWTVVHSPLFDKDKNVIFVLQNAADVTELVHLKEAAAELPFRLGSGEVELVQRAQEAEEAYRATAIESAEFRRLFQQAPGLIAITQGPEHRFSFANDSFRRLLGDREVINATIRQVLPEIEGQGLIEMLDAVHEAAAAQPSFGLPLVLGLPGEATRQIFVELSLSPVRDHSGNISGVLLQGADRTDAIRFERRQRLLIDELNHRVKNTLATVQAIARQSFRSAKAPETAKAAFEARIIALSRAHNLLSGRHWEAAELTQLLEQELSVFAADRFDLNGPEIDLNPKAAIALAMVFHELATNAAKYGAFASDDGELLVEWTQFPDETGDILALRWIETGAPKKPKSLKGGFGAMMLARIVEGELSGRLAIELQPDGINCQVEVPLFVLEQGADSVAN
ncbi:HWE histidine kinase domain-containing protein [Consotaella aegiceratis]|uniref:HWE histidine kinase domain-containing protein n=1 Tax=Consotaella aegiceratis TaxID=3097961 RepID=UPI002F41670A